MTLLLLFFVWFGQGPTQSHRPTNAQQQDSPNVPSPIRTQSLAQTGNESQQRQNSAAQWSDPIVLLQLFLFFAVALQAGVYVWQAILMRGTLKVLRNQGKTQASQATSMRLQVAVSEWQGGIMEVQAGLFDKQLKAMREQMEVMRDQVIIAGKQSELTAQQIELMVLSESAYVTVGEDWKVDEDSFNNNILIVHGQIHNGGRTPALNFKRKIQIAIGDGKPPRGWGRFDWDSNADESESIVLVSGGKVNCSTPPMELSEEILHDVVTGKQMVVIDGQCRYSDILGGEQVYTYGLALDWISSRTLIRYQDYRREKANSENPN
jgi:hypothetical protein